MRFFRFLQPTFVNPPACDKTHYRCPSYHKWDGAKLATFAFGTLGFVFVAFIVTLFCATVWKSTVGAPPKTAAQITALAKADSEKASSNLAALQAHIPECQKINAYWNERYSDCEQAK